MAWSIFAFIFLPDTPMNAFFLTHQEKVFWIQRLAANKTGIVNNQWKWDQVLEAVIDPKTWLIFFFNIAINIPNGGKYFPLSRDPQVTLTIVNFRLDYLQWYNYQESWIHLYSIFAPRHAHRCHVYYSFYCFLFFGC